MIKITNLYKIYKYRRKTITALKKINLELPNSGFFVISGKSGCGKTTLLNCISGLLPFNGSISINNQVYNKQVDYRLRQNEIARVFQDSFLIQNKSVYDNIKYACNEKNKAKANEKISFTLNKLGILKLINRKVNTLSGGQQQRVAIARAIINNPKIILADEPTAHLDSANKKIILDILNELSKTILIILVTHEKNTVINYAERIIFLEKGQILKEETLEKKVANSPLEIKPVKHTEISKELLKSNNSTSIRKQLFNKLNLNKKSIFTLLLFPLLLLLSVLFISQKQEIEDYMFSNHYKDEVKISTTNGFAFKQDDIDYIKNTFDDLYINPIYNDFTFFELSWDYLIQHKNAKYTQGVITFTFVSELMDIKFCKEIVYGRLPNSIDEVVIDKSQVNYLSNSKEHSDYTFSSMAIDSYENFVGSTLTFFNGIELKIVGISDTYSNCIYCSKDLINYYAYNKGLDKPHKISSNYEYINKDFIDYDDIFVNETTYKDLENKDILRINDESFNIKGVFSDNNNASCVINKERFDDLVIKEKMLSSSSIDIITSNIQKLSDKYDIFNYYENEKNNYLIEQKNQTIQIVVIFTIFIIVTSYVLYVNIKSDYMYLYNEMILKIILGKSKLSVLGNFLLLEFIKISMISLPIFALVSLFLQQAFEYTGKVLNLIMLNSFNITLGYLLLPALTVLVSIFILRKILFKHIGNLKINFNNF